MICDLELPAEGCALSARRPRRVRVGHLIASGFKGRLTMSIELSPMRRCLLRIHMCSDGYTALSRAASHLSQAMRLLIPYIISRSLRSYGCLDGTELTVFKTVGPSA